MLARKANPGNLRVVPLDGKGDRRVAQHAEVVGVVRVLPDVFAVDDQVSAEGLLQAGMEFVAIAGSQRRQRLRGSRLAADSSTGDAASQAGEHQVLVERRLQRAGIGDAKHGVGLGLML